MFVHVCACCYMSVHVFACICVFVHVYACLCSACLCMLVVHVYACLCMVHVFAAFQGCKKQQLCACLCMFMLVCACLCLFVHWCACLYSLYFGMKKQQQANAIKDGLDLAKKVECEESHFSNICLNHLNTRVAQKRKMALVQTISFRQIDPVCLPLLHPIKNCCWNKRPLQFSATLPVKQTTSGPGSGTIQFQLHFQFAFPSYSKIAQACFDAWACPQTSTIIHKQAQTGIKMHTYARKCT